VGPGGGAAPGPPDLRGRHRHRRRDRGLRRPAAHLAFRSSFRATGSGTPAFWSFVAFYAVCFVVTYAVYMRSGQAATDPRTGTRLSYAQV
jgi:hypothetical protein